MEVTYAPRNVTLLVLALGTRKVAGDLVEPVPARSQLCQRLPSHPEAPAGSSWNAPSEASNSHALVAAGPLNPGSETWTASHGRSLQQSAVRRTSERGREREREGEGETGRAREGETGETGRAREGERERGREGAHTCHLGQRQCHPHERRVGPAGLVQSGGP